MGDPRPRIISVYRDHRDRDKGRMARLKYLVAPRPSPGPDPGRLSVEITRVWGKDGREIPDVPVDSPDPALAFAGARRHIQAEHSDMLVVDPGDVPDETGR